MVRPHTSTGRLALVLMLSIALLAGWGVPPASSAPAPGRPLTDVATSPAGAADDAPDSALPQKMLQRGRSFRGNPVPLGILTGIVLLVAFVLGVYTLVLVYRRPPDDDDR